jgi:hypothetical protein
MVWSAISHRAIASPRGTTSTDQRDVTSRDLGRAVCAGTQPHRHRRRDTSMANPPMRLVCAPGEGLVPGDRPNHSAEWRSFLPDSNERNPCLLVRPGCDPAWGSERRPKLLDVGRLAWMALRPRRGGWLMLTRTGDSGLRSTQHVSHVLIRIARAIARWPRARRSYSRVCARSSTDS